MPWNVDTISKPGFTKTIVNVPKTLPTEENLTEEEKNKRLETFINTNKSKLKVFGMFKKYKDSQEYLQKNPELVCEDTANYLVIWCIDLQMEGVSSVSYRCKFLYLIHLYSSDTSFFFLEIRFNGTRSTSNNLYAIYIRTFSAIKY